MKPEDVLHNWDVPSLNNLDPNKIKRPGSGLLNQTYIIRSGENDEEMFILQCVHPAVSMDGALNNYFHVTHFLRKQGLPSQELLLNKQGKLFVESENNWRWRLMRGVEGLYFDTTTNPDIAYEGGKLLGQFHATLSQYTDELEIGRISFRYTDEIAKLRQYEKQLMEDPDETIRNATQTLLSELPKLMLPENLNQVIIHGDPKISNFLFTEDNKGICIIDMDTIQKLSPLYDIGDAIRSWCGQEEDNPNNSFNVEIYNSFLKGYMSTSKGLLSAKEQSLIPQAAKLIMIGLATRFLNDYVDDSYFGFDETKYSSRKEHNKARTLGQLSLYQSFVKLT